LGDFYGRVILPENCVLTVVGDVTVEEARRWTQTYFGKWSGPPFRPPAVPQEPVVSESRKAHQPNPKKQVHVVLGFPGTTLTSGDFFALQVLDTVLSGQGGRLFRELRDRQGLAYSVTSFSQAGLDPGYFGTYIATAPENLDRAIAGLKEELERISRERILPEELERARQYIVGHYEIAHQTHAAQAMTMGLDERYGMGFDFGQRYLQGILAVSEEEVQRVAQKYLRMERHVLAVVGPSP
jgi:zinc protease